MLFLNFLAIIFILLAYLAPWINPKTFWPVAFFGIAYPVLLIINILFILFWLLRKPPVALLSLVIILLGWNALRKNLGFHINPETPAKTTTDIRLMTYNVHMFRSFDESHTLDRKKAILNVFQEIAPDVLCLQEFYTRKKGENDLQSALKNEFGFKHHFFSPVAQNEYDAYGIAIFSKYPILRTGYITLQQSKPGHSRLLYADIQVGNQEIRVYNIHLKSIGFKQEDYAFIRKANTDMEEDITSTKRIGGRLKAAFQKRAQEAEALSAHLQACPVPFLVAGDFNDTPLSFAVNKISRNAQNTFVKKGSGWGITYNGDFPNFQIDYIMASADFRVRHYAIIKQKLSDHYPVWTDLSLKD